MKKNRNVKIVSFISLISVILLASTATFAWFYMNSDVEVDYGSEIICETGSSLEISLLDGVDENGEQVWTPWSTSIKKDSISAKLQDISGNGIDLLTPTRLKNVNGVLTPEEFTVSKPIDPENGFGDYIELEAKLRSTSLLNIYFAGESSILPYEIEENIKNVFGNFSQNYIAGAMRLAVLEVNEDASQDLKMIWAPNPNYELKRNNTTGQYSFTENGTVEQFKYYKYTDKDNNVVELHNVTADEIVNNQFVVGSTECNDVMVNNSPVLTKIVPDETGYGISHLIIRVWFEGCDRESNQALSGGHCKMKFVFSGMEAKDAPTQATIDSIDAISYATSTTTTKDENENDIINYFTKWSNVSDDTYFSLNGYDWTKYEKNGSTDNLPNLYQIVMKNKKTTAIYFKAMETLTNLAYIRKVEIVYDEGGKA